MSDWEALNPAIASSSALTSAGWPWWAQTVISPVPSPGFGVSPPASGLPPPHAETARTDAATSAMLQRPRDVCMATSNLCSPLLANRFAKIAEVPRPVNGWGFWVVIGDAGRSRAAPALAGPLSRAARPLWRHL